MLESAPCERDRRIDGIVLRDGPRGVEPVTRRELAGAHQPDGERILTWEQVYDLTVPNSSTDNAERTNLILGHHGNFDIVDIGQPVTLDGQQVVTGDHGDQNGLKMERIGRLLRICFCIPLVEVSANGNRIKSADNPTRI